MDINKALLLWVPSRRGKGAAKSFPVGLLYVGRILEDPFDLRATQREGQILRQKKYQAPDAPSLQGNPGKAKFPKVRNTIHK